MFTLADAQFWYIFYSVFVNSFNHTGTNFFGGNFEVLELDEKSE